MIPEIGHFTLILALCVSIVLAIVPLYGTLTRQQALINIAVPATRIQFALLLVSFFSLMYSFINLDFSVSYVANNSNTHQPLLYRISAVWGAHEGSLLMWFTMLSLWGTSVSVFSKRLPKDFVALVLCVLGFIGVGLALFILMTSNPFERILPAVLEGRELNPLLQDPGLAFHPPLLYMGYVGLSVPFAFAIAALIDGNLDQAWLRWSRPWTVLSWVFLTIGIALGSWWAYYELGWGGWWFWDPVENASFMPWLIATALLHSLAVTEQRGAFKSWTVLLAIVGFSMSLLGTFLVRSGVLVSVHAFASDPARGVFILIFLGIVIGISLLLYTWRVPILASNNRFEWFSRDTLLLMNNVLLTVASASILLGTLYPLFLDALEMGKISVGPPFFNTVFVPLMLPLVFLIGIGPLTRWKKDTVSRLVKKLAFPLILSLIAGALFIWLNGYDLSPLVIVSTSMFFWILFTIVIGFRDRGKHGNSKSKMSAGFIGMNVAHTGMAVVVLGITLTSAFSIEEDVRMKIGDSVNIGGWDFRFDGVSKHNGPNYAAQQGILTASREGETPIDMRPEKRSYVSQTMPMTEAAIDAGVTRDLYIAMGEELKPGIWSVRIYHKPYIQWIWFGPMLMALGGLISITDRRYRLKIRQTERTVDASSKNTDNKAVEAV